MGNKAITAEDIGGFDPIPNLKPGDKLKLRSEKLRKDKWPAEGEIVTVYRVDVPLQSHEPGRPICRNDFTVLFDDGDDIDAIEEFSYDSRRFVRVE